MFQELSRRRVTHDKSASRIDLGPPKTLTGAFSSNDDANWWMITLSDLTLLLLGFLVAWYVIDKKDIVLQQPPVASPGMAQEAKPSIAPSHSSLVPDEWTVFQDEMQRFVGEIGLDKDVFIESAPNGNGHFLEGYRAVRFGKGGLATASCSSSRKSRDNGFESSWAVVGSQWSYR
jgi:hypothetical protein